MHKNAGERAPCAARAQQTCNTMRVCYSATHQLLLLLLLPNGRDERPGALALHLKGLKVGRVGSHDVRGLSGESRQEQGRLRWHRS